MSKLTNEQIEATITQSHADIVAVLAVTKDERVTDRAITGALRATFTAGSDHGQGVILERAAEMFASAVGDAQQLQLATSMRLIAAWCAPVDHKPLAAYYCGPGVGPGMSYVWRVRLYRGTWQSAYFEGSDMTEALSKAANWCRLDTAEYDQDGAPLTERANACEGDA